MLNNVPPFLEVSQIEVSSASTSSATATPRLLITAVHINPLFDNQAPLLPSSFHHHLKDIKHTSYYDKKNNEHIFVFECTSKGSIKAICKGIIRASRNNDEGYGGFVASQEMGARAEECLKSLIPGYNIEITPEDLEALPKASQGNEVHKFYSNSSPVLLDTGEVISANIGSQRRSKKIQAFINRLERCVVNPHIPESWVFYDELGSQGYASTFNPHLINLDDYLREFPTDKATYEFIKKHAGDFGAIVAQALFTGNVDLHLGNIFYDKQNQCLILFDNDRTYMLEMGKYFAYLQTQIAGYFPPINQRDIYLPEAPIDFSPQAWFHTIFARKSKQKLPFLFQRELVLPGFNKMMQINHHFDLAYYTTLYAFSRMEQVHFTELASFAIQDPRLRAKVANDFAQRAKELSFQLWSMPAFYDTYMEHRSAFNDKTASLATSNIHIPALTDAEIEDCVNTALEHKIAQMSDPTVFTERLNTDFSNETNNSTILHALINMARYIDMELLCLKNIDTAYSDRLSEAQKNTLDVLSQQYESKEAIIDKMIKDSELKEIRHTREDRSINTNEDISALLDKVRKQKDIYSLSDALNKATIELLLFNQHLPDFMPLLDIFERLHNDLIFDWMDWAQNIANNILKLIDKWVAELEFLDSSTLHTPEQCLQLYALLNIKRPVALLTQLSLAGIVSGKTYNFYQNKIEESEGILRFKREMLITQINNLLEDQDLFAGSDLSLMDQIYLLNASASFFGQNPSQKVMQTYHQFICTAQDEIESLPDQLNSLLLDIKDMSRLEKLDELRCVYLLASGTNKLNERFQVLIENVKNCAIKANRTSQFNVRAPRGRRLNRATEISPLYSLPRMAKQIDTDKLSELISGLQKKHSLEAFAHAYEHSSWKQADASKPGFFSTNTTVNRPAEAVQQYEIYQRYCAQQIDAEAAWSQIVNLAIMAQNEGNYSKTAKLWFESFEQITPCFSVDEEGAIDDLWQAPEGFACLRGAEASTSSASTIASEPSYESKSRRYSM